MFGKVIHFLSKGKSGGVGVVILIIVIILIFLFITSSILGKPGLIGRLARFFD